MIDILYVASNRLEFTRESFDALVENTNWTEVSWLLVCDDGSTDGTAEWLSQRCDEIDHGSSEFVVNVDLHFAPFGGPVAAMNLMLDSLSPGVEMFAKLDNDMVVPPGWLDDMLRTMTSNPGLDILGMEPFVGNPTASPSDRGITPAEHIGGKGLIRTRAFSQCRPVPGGVNGYQGFTQWQHQHPQVSKAWVTPDLLCFGLDQIDLDPFPALTDTYVGKGWMRRWPQYANGGKDYYSWWTPKHL